ncbi:MAG: hypothetical protein ACWGQW_22895 [bacterium]
MQRIKTFLQMAAIVISLMGVVTFSLFILEESFQTAMFGTWPAQDAKDWRLAKTGVEFQEKVVWWMKAVNYTVGWIQPLGFIAYKSYAESADFYMAGLKAKIFANCSECFHNEEVEFTFYPLTVQDNELINHQVHVVIPDGYRASLQPVVVRGVVRAEEQLVRIETIEIKAVSE